MSKVVLGQLTFAVEARTFLGVDESLLANSLTCAVAVVVLFTFAQHQESNHGAENEYRQDDIDYYSNLHFLSEMKNYITQQCHPSSSTF